MESYFFIQIIKNIGKIEKSKEIQLIRRIKNGYLIWYRLVKYL